MDSSEKPSNRTTSAQQKLMFKYIEEHPQMLRSRFDKDYTRREANRLWKKLSDALNALDGPKKISSEWRRSWTNMKCLRRKPEGKDCTLPLPGTVPEPDNEEESLHSFPNNSNELSPVVVKHEDPLELEFAAVMENNEAPREKEKSNLPPLENQTLPEEMTTKDPVPRCPTEAIDVQLGGHNDRDELYRKQIALMERQTVALETLNQTMQFQGTVLMQLAESINNFSSAIRKMQNGNC